MRWERIDCDSVEWEGFDEGLADETTTDVRWLHVRDPWIVEARHPATSVSPAHYHPFDVVYLYTAGSVSMASEPGQPEAGIQPTTYTAGDLRFVKAGTVYGPETTGPDGSLFYTFTFGGRPSVAYANEQQQRAGTKDLMLPGPDAWWRGRWADGDWTDVVVVADESRQQASGRILSEFGIHAAMIRLNADERLDSLRHESECIFLPTVGSAIIGSKESYGTRDFRWTAAKEDCGPIVGGPMGCEFLLLSVCAPVVVAP